MAEYQGMKVKLNSPTAIRKGEPGYGRKSKKVFVMKNGKVKKVMFGDPNMAIRKKIRQLQDIGLAKNGKGELWEQEQNIILRLAKSTKVVYTK
jgi:hypothetical protein